jgi:hypothetical protein
MSTLRVNNLTNQANDGGIEFAVQPVIDGLCKAWVNFNGTGTVAIRAAYNVTSITDNGTGNYTVNLTTAMSDANYFASVFGTSAVFDTAWTANCITSRTTSGVTFGVGYPRSTGGSSTAIDAVEAGVAIFR